MTCESKTKPSCDWSDPDSRSELVDGLVTDGLRLIEAVEDIKLDPEQADALGLLGVVTGQDVEPDPHREGRWRIARRVARDRTISTVDPEARHGHKTRTRKRTGHRRGPNRCQHPRRRQYQGSRCRPTPGCRNRRGFGVRVRCGARNVRQTWSHPGGETNRTQTPHQRRVPPRRLRYRHQRTDSDVSRRAHHPPTSRRYLPLLQTVQRLPPAGTMHHLGEGTDHRSRQTPRPAGGKQSTVGQRRNPKHLPDLPAVRGTDHRLAHPPQSQTRSLPRIIPNQQWLTTPTAAINLQRLINLGLTHTTTGWALNPT